MYPTIIVEDESILLDGLVKMVRDADIGFEVLGKAANGQEAMELIATLNPVLVITDIRMPKMDGLELTAWIHQEQPNIKVIIVTGYSDFSFAQQAIKLGVADFLLKPVKKEELIQALGKVKSVLDHRFSFETGFILEPKLSTIFEGIIQAIQMLNPEKAEVETVRFWEVLNSRQNYQWHLQLQLAASFLDNIRKRIPDVEISSNMTWVEGLFGLENNNQPKLLQYLTEQINLLIAKTADQRKFVSRKAVSKAKEYIEANFAADIGLKQIADTVYLNSSYFSLIFKEITGENFINYLTRVRIEKAQKLLEEPDLKIYEIAQAVGYTDQAYFSRIFKQVVGINPIEYRRRFGL